MRDTWKDDMKWVIGSLALGLAVLAAVLTLANLVRSEGKKTRLAITKALSEPLNQPAREESVIQKLDAISAQLASLSKRLTLLEDGAGRAASASRTQQPIQADLQSLTRTVSGLSANVGQLKAVPSHIAELASFVDRSFEHLEKKVEEAGTPPGLQETVSRISGKVDDIDSYFTPLYTFLGLPYEPAAQDVLAVYPSVDERINELNTQLKAIREETATLREVILKRMLGPPLPTH